MKKLWKMCGVVTVAIMLCSSVTVLAQEQRTMSESRITPKFGIKGGLNLSNMFVDNISDENMKVGWNAGLYAKVPLARGISLQPELMYSLKGAKQDFNNLPEGTGDYRFNLHYIELPVLAVFNVAKNFNLHVGPYAAYLVGADVRDRNGNGTIARITQLEADDFNRFDWGVAGGLGVDVQNFTLGARYTLGLRDIGESGNLSGIVTNDSRNGVISIYIGLGL